MAVNSVEVFRNHLLESGVLDPEGVHHEFVSGMHGQKLEFEKVEVDSPLYREWVDVNTETIRQIYDPLPEIILGVANGTNRLAMDVARELGREVKGFPTKKDEKKVIRLTSLGKHVIGTLKPSLVVVVEDVGTRGTNSVQPAVAARINGARRVEVLTTWKRRTSLELLDEQEVSYRAIIDEPLPTYTPEECRDIGFCALNWQFIRRPK